MSTIKVRKIAGEFPIITAVLTEQVEFDAEGYAEASEAAAEVLAQIPNEYEILDADALAKIQATLEQRAQEQGTSEVESADTGSVQPQADEDDLLALAKQEAAEQEAEEALAAAEAVKAAEAEQASEVAEVVQEEQASEESEAPVVEEAEQASEAPKAPARPKRTAPKPQ